MDETKGVVRIMYGEDCNTCHNYDPITGLCSIDKMEHRPYEDACEKWVDWEDYDER